MTNLTLGSLFDGSGGFPLGGILSGIKPIWASEIEPFPIRVTEENLPDMKHLGDISGLKGSEIEPVDIITFGSPCQDMSVAGGRDGLGGERSKLFFEAIRIIKEMRLATDGQKPRWIVWENVTGAFSSNRGNDFRCVLEEICKVKDEAVSIPSVDKWTNAGEVLGESYSIAWRTLDAQFWGVPQRRKRIFLVADFDGASAGKVLFESEGVSGYSAESFRAWQRAARCVEKGAGETSTICLNDQGDSQMAVTVFEPKTFGICSKDSNAMKSENPKSGFYEAETSRTIDRNGGNPSCNQGGIAVAQPVYSTSKAGYHTRIYTETVSLIASDYKDPPTITEAPYYIVRRLMPVECARLQGFPDWWCDDLGIEAPSDDEVKKWMDIFEAHRKAVDDRKKPKTENQVRKWLKNPFSDTAAYKMWGNGVALPCVWFVLAGIVYFDKE